MSAPSQFRLTWIAAGVWFAAAAACGLVPDAAREAATPPNEVLDELRALDAARDYFALRDRVAAASNVDVYTGPVRDEAYLHCNIGLDVLRQVKGYRLNFRFMTLTFR